MKPIEFEDREIGQGINVFCPHDAFRIGHSGFWLGLEIESVRNLEKACAEFITAHREASKLTRGDLVVGDYFRLPSDPNGAIRCVVPLGYNRYPSAQIPDDEPVIKLEVTIEVVE